MAESAQDFLEQLRDSVQSWGDVEWLADRVDGDAIVVLHRWWRTDRDDRDYPVEGVRLVFDDFARCILGPGEHRIRDILGEATLEIVEPHELGQHLAVPWADGMTARPTEVLWHGDAVAYATRSASEGL